MIFKRSEDISQFGNSRALSFFSEILAYFPFERALHISARPERPTPLYFSLPALTSDIASFPLLGNCHCKLKKWQTALKNFQTALRILDKLYDEPNLEIVRVRENIANTYLQDKQLEEAEKEYSEVLEIKRKLVGANSKEMGNTLYNYSIFLAKVGKKDDALKSLAQAKYIFDKNFGRHNQYSKMVDKQQTRILIQQ